MAELRVVGEETAPLSLDEPRSHGDTLLADAKRSATGALRASTSVDLFRSGALTLTQVKLLHQQTKSAVTAWWQVEAMLGELVREFDKSRSSARHKRSADE